MDAEHCGVSVNEVAMHRQWLFHSKSQWLSISSPSLKHGLTVGLTCLIKEMELDRIIGNQLS